MLIYYSMQKCHCGRVKGQKYISRGDWTRNVEKLNVCADIIPSLYNLLTFFIDSLKCIFAQFDFVFYFENFVFATEAFQWTE